MRRKGAGRWMKCRSEGCTPADAKKMLCSTLMHQQRCTVHGCKILEKPVTDQWWAPSLVDNPFLRLYSNPGAICSLARLQHIYYSILLIAFLRGIVSRERTQRSFRSTDPKNPWLSSAFSWAYQEHLRSLLSIRRGDDSSC